MNRGFRLPGALWIVGGVLSGLLVLVTLDVPATALLLAGGAIVGVALGVLLIWRPSSEVVRASSIAGLAWLVAFGWLTVSNLDKPAGEWLSGLVLAALGVAGAVLAYSRRGTAGS